MKFAEKKQAYQNLQDPAHLKFDRELLEKKAPKSPALTIGMVNKEKAQREILWALLDVAEVDEILANRPAPIKKLTKADILAIVEEAGKLTAHIHKAETIEAKNELVEQIKILVKELPEGVTSVVIKLAESIIPDAVKKAEFTQKLLTADLETIKQPEAASIARGLNFQPENFKLATLKPLLQDYLANIPKIGKATGEKMTEVPEGEELTSTESHSDQVIDQMNAEKEELEAENEDLKEQLEDAEAEKEDLEEQLEEEKKSEQQPDPE